MVGYDFDKTIFKGDSSTKFFFYMVFTRVYPLLFSPWFLICVLFYGLKILNKSQVKQCLFFFVRFHKNIDKISEKFWKKKIKGIEPFYLAQQKSDDVIVSASLDFVLEPAMKMLGVTNFICTKFDKKSGKIVGKNCYGEQKRILFEEKFGKTELDAFYSDSLSDLPMMKISKKAFLVKKGKVKEFDAKNF